MILFLFVLTCLSEKYIIYKLHYRTLIVNILHPMILHIVVGIPIRKVDRVVQASYGKELKIFARMICMMQVSCTFYS